LTLKAGIMGIADINVKRKPDREGADRVVSAIGANLWLHACRPANGVRDCQNHATSGDGIGSLVDAIDQHRPRPRSPAAAGFARNTACAGVGALHELSPGAVLAGGRCSWTASPGRAVHGGAVCQDCGESR
jgi:hypothetical protein